MSKKEEKITSFMKIIYFDEEAASDYVIIKNGGTVKWDETQKDENGGTVSAKVSVSAEVGGRANGFIAFAKAAFSGKIQASTDNNSSNAIENIISNALLTDYILLAKENSEEVIEFCNKSVYAPENSISQYRMYSSFIDLISPDKIKEETQIDISKLNGALMNERGYYPMLVGDGDKPEAVLRFNISAFKNNYSLADLAKMNLRYLGVKVGQCNKDELSIDKEFTFEKKKKKPSAKEAVDGVTESEAVDEKTLNIYDIVLAGVKND